MEEKVKGVFTKLLETAAIFALAVFLIRLAVCWLMQIWWVLIILAVLILAGFFGWHWWKTNRSNY